MLSDSLYLNTSVIHQNKNVNPQVRTIILKAFTQVTISITKGAYAEVISEQKETHENQYGLFNEREAEIDAVNRLNQPEAISFDIINPSLVYFNEDKQTIGIITTAKPSSIEYINLYQLIQAIYPENEHLKDSKQPITLEHYKSMHHSQFLREIKRLFNLKNCITEQEKIANTSPLESIESLVGSYVFTADNYIKMIMLLLRIKAKIPVIMMGETGCGKTALIRMMAQLANKHMKILNINAGTGDEDIKTFMNKIEKEIATEHQQNVSDIWVFLDEINTCHSMGLIAEMMCKHTIEGKTISNHIVFIAACNPYRSIKRQISINGLILNSNDRTTNLVYNVNPLPFSLLNFVFYFGSLREVDEKKYILSMLKYPLETILPFGENNTLINNEFIEIVSNVIALSQKFIRDKGDISSVSLREVRRVVVLYEWFTYFINNSSIASTTTELTSLIPAFEAIILSIYICYYLRLVKKELRAEFRLMINDHFKGYMSNDINDLLIDIPEKHQRNIIERMKLPPGIAMNRALRENIFAAFICVNNLIPLFICGKPGCSKSLSVKLLIEAMKGSRSSDKLFKSFPMIHSTSYQGTLTTTSKNVLSLFNSARQIVRKNKTKAKGKANNKVISLIYFEEMGLAEQSKHNPLKVIHSQLEYDDNEDKVAFIGVSNWVLDASKMNRGIFLSIPEFDEEDLIETSKAIAVSFRKDALVYSNIKLRLESLSKTYCDYKLRIRTYKNLYADFHGLRDFYSLIKYLLKNSTLNSINTDKNKANVKDTFPDVNEIAIKSIERNFGGAGFSIREFKQLYFNNNKPIKAHTKIEIGTKNKNENEAEEPLLNPNSATLINCVIENVCEKDDRFLIIISKASRSHFLLDSLLTKVNKDYSFYVGSQFEKDKDEDDYGINILTKIQRCMSQARVLVLKELEFIYSSLYDLFNQTFIYRSNKAYTRIAFGLTKTPLSFVHQDFKCVILIDEEEVRRHDPPFLNRFEKQILSFENILTSDLIEKSKIIAKEIRSLIISNPKHKGKLSIINLENQLLNFDLDEIQAILYLIHNEEDINKGKSKDGIRKKQSNKEHNDNNSALIIKVLTKLVPTFSQDLMCFMRYSNFKYEKEAIAIYEKDCHQNIYKYIQSTMHYKSIVYTFFSIYDDISINGSMNTQLIGKITINSINQLIISSIKSQSEFEAYLNNFYSNKAKAVCIIKFAQNDYAQLNHIQFMIQNAESEGYINEKKMFIFIVYYKRIMKNSQEEVNAKDRHLMSHLSSFYQLFIDNVNGKDIMVTKILNMTSTQFLQNKQLIDIEKAYKANLYYAYMKIKITPLNLEVKAGKEAKNTELSSNEESTMLFLVNNTTVMKEILNSIMNQIEKEKDLIISLFYENVNQNETYEFKLFNKNEDILSNLESYLLFEFKKHLTGIIVALEKNSMISEILLSNKHNEKGNDVNSEIMHMLIDSIRKIDLTEIIPSLIDQSNVIAKTQFIRLPGSKCALDQISSYVTTISDQFFSNEDALRKGITDFNELQIKFQSTEKQLIDDVNNKMRQIPFMIIIKQIEPKKGKQDQQMQSDLQDKAIKANLLFEHFEHDYYTYFLAKHFQLYSFEVINFIRIILKLKYDDQLNDSYYQLARNILWLESNVLLLKPYIHFFITLMKYKPDLIASINSILHNNEIEFEASNKLAEYRYIVNRPFFLIFEALIKITYTQLSLSSDLLLKDYLKSIKEIAYRGNQIELNLWFTSKHLIALNVFIIIADFYSQLHNTIDSKKLIDYLNNINLEMDFVKQKDVEKLSTYLGEDYSRLSLEFKTLTDFPKAYILILIEKYKLLQNDIYRMKILNIVISNPHLLFESSPLLKYYFRNYNISELPQITDDAEFEDTFIQFKNESNASLNLLNDSQDPKVISFVLFYFQKIIDLMFTDQYYIKTDKANDVNLLGVLLNCFDFALNYITNVIDKQDNLKHLALLYSIAFVKVFLSYYVHQCIHKLIDLSSVNKILVGKGPSPIRQVIKIYVLKLFNDHLGWEKLCQSPIWKTKYHITWIEEFELYSKDDIENKAVLDYLFISETIKDEKEYNKINQQLTSKINTNLDKEHILLFFDLTIVPLILSHSFKANKNNNDNNNNKYDQLIKSSTLQTDWKKLLCLLYDPNEYYSFASIINKKDMEMFLYCFKLCLLFIVNWNEGLFSWYTIEIESVLSALININYSPKDSNTNIAYHLLQLIFHSILFFGNAIKLVSNEVMTEIFQKENNKPVSDKIKQQWTVLKRQIANKDIYIFLNMIYNDLHKVLPNMIKLITTEQFKNKTLDQLNELIRVIIDNIILPAFWKYDEYSNKYKEINGKLSHHDYKSLKAIIKEKCFPEVYSEAEYPFLILFMLEHYPTKDLLQEQLMEIDNNANAYPIVSIFLHPIKKI